MSPPHPPIPVIPRLPQGSDMGAHRDKQFISCTYCRKVKCPGERPTCSNCHKKRLHCHYDAVRKRRGPDKEPGGRLRPRNFCVTPLTGPNKPSGRTGYSAWPHSDRDTRNTLQPSGVDHSSTSTATSETGILESWWTLLFESLPEDQVVEHCRQFLEDRNTWFNFFHRGRFFQALFARTLTPHVVFAILSHTTFLRGGNSRTGRLRALHFAEQGRKMLDYALDVGFQDPTLVHTALLLAAFEFQPHIHQNLARATAALSYIETCARVCGGQWVHCPSSIKSGCKHHCTNTVEGCGAAHTIRKEELRRMCSVLGLLAANSTLWRILSEQQVLKLPIADPTRFGSLFPVDPFNTDVTVAKTDSSRGWGLHRSICLWYLAVNHAPDQATKTKMVQEARGIAENSQRRSSPGNHQVYFWEAEEWALAALGHLGDLDEEDMIAWFRLQLDTIKQCSQFQPMCHSPPNSWWLLAIVFTALQLLRQAPCLRTYADPVISQVFEVLEELLSVWPCSTLEHHARVLRQQSDIAMSGAPRPGCSN